MQDPPWYIYQSDFNKTIYMSISLNVTTLQKTSLFA